MKILAIDSSTSKASVALLSDEEIVEKMEIQDGKTHSEKLLPMIKRVIEEAGFKPVEIDCFAVAVGPGSFTGLRIGVTTIKAMAMAANKSCAPVSSLDALAYNSRGFEGIICPLIDARNNQAFSAIYICKAEELPLRMTEYMAKSIDEIVEDVKVLCKSHNLKNVLLNGDGAKKHIDVFSNRLGANDIICVVADESELLANAVSTAKIACEMVKAGKTVQSHILVPEYLRKSSAEQIKEGIIFQK